MESHPPGPIEPGTQSRHAWAWTPVGVNTKRHRLIFVPVKRNVRNHRVDFIWSLDFRKIATALDYLLRQAQLLS